MSAAYVALGSNLGDKKDNLRRALELLGEQVTVTQISSFYETKPYGVTDQPDFVNAVCAVETRLGAEQLLQILLQTENAMGRVRLRPWGERKIDLDLLLYDDLVYQSASLTLPHPGLAQREFVLRPLAEIASELLHPVLQTTMTELLRKL